MSAEEFPEHLPEHDSELSADEKRAQAIAAVERNRQIAIARVAEIADQLDHDQLIRKLHTATTNVMDGNLNKQRHRYYTLWTGFGDYRLLDTGELAVRIPRRGHLTQESLHPDNDLSHIVTPHELRVNRNEFTLQRLGELAGQLDKLATKFEPDPPADDPEI